MGREGGEKDGWGGGDRWVAPEREYERRLQRVSKTRGTIAARSMSTVLCAPHLMINGIQLAPSSKQAYVTVVLQQNCCHVTRAQQLDPENLAVTRSETDAGLSVLLRALANS